MGSYKGAALSVCECGPDALTCSTRMVHHPLSSDGFYRSVPPATRLARVAFKRTGWAKIARLVFITQSAANGRHKSARNIEQGRSSCHTIHRPAALGSYSHASSNNMCLSNWRKKEQPTHCDALSTL